jgi:hypothetical protein
MKQGDRAYPELSQNIVHQPVQSFVLKEARAKKKTGRITGSAVIGGSASMTKPIRSQADLPLKTCGE